MPNSIVHESARYARFSDIPKFISSGNWECSFRVQNVWRQIAEWQATEGLDINPDFQRLHVWTEAQQVAWIEFLLRGGRTGRTFYFNAPGWNRTRVAAEMVLVDGKQRLEAIRRFFANEIRVFGSLYAEFTDEPDMMRGGIVLFNVNDLPTRADVLRWYIEMNAGGTPHTAEEIAKAERLLRAVEAPNA